MREDSSDFDAYRSPQADVGSVQRAPPAISPRQRFWLACLWCFLGAPVCFALLRRTNAPAEVAVIVAIAAYSIPVFWVLFAHAGTSRGVAIPFRMAIVWLGLSLAMFIAASLGLATGVAAARLVGHQAWFHVSPA